MIYRKRIFITGGAGFIGSALIGRLIQNNKIIVYDNFDRNSLHGKSYSEHENLEIATGDILHYQKLAKALVNAQIVIHAAAIAGIYNTIKKTL